MTEGRGRPASKSPTKCFRFVRRMKAGQVDIAKREAKRYKLTLSDYLMLVARCTVNVAQAADAPEGACAAATLYGTQPEHVLLMREDSAARIWSACDALLWTSDSIAQSVSYLRANLYAVQAAASFDAGTWRAMLDARAGHIEKLCFALYESAGELSGIDAELRRGRRRGGNDYSRVRVDVRAYPAERAALERNAAAAGTNLLDYLCLLIASHPDLSEFKSMERAEIEAIRAQGLFSGREVQVLEGFEDEALANIGAYASYAREIAEKLDAMRADVRQVAKGGRLVSLTNDMARLQVLLEQDAARSEAPRDVAHAFESIFGATTKRGAGRHPRVHFTDKPGALFQAGEEGGARYGNH